MDGGGEVRGGGDLLIVSFLKINSSKMNKRLPCAKVLRISVEKDSLSYLAALGILSIEILMLSLMTERREGSLVMIFNIISHGSGESSSSLND